MKQPNSKTPTADKSPEKSLRLRKMTLRRLSTTELDQVAAGNHPTMTGLSICNTITTWGP